MNLQNGTAAFLIHSRMARDLSPLSAKLYASILGGFQRFAGPRISLDAAARRVDDFLIARARAGLGDHARRKTFEVTRLFYRWAAEKGHARANPLVDVRAPKVADRPVQVITKAEALKLIKAARESGRLHARRDSALIATMFYAGLRVGEAVRLRVGDADLESGISSVYGKGGKFRAVPIHPQLSAILKGWLRERPQGSPLLFPSQPPGWRTFGQLDDCRVERVIRDHYAPAAQLAARVTPHTLRRTFATTLYRKGVKIGRIQRLLGHTDERTTRRYLQVGDEDLAADVGRL